MFVLFVSAVVLLAITSHPILDKHPHLIIHPLFLVKAPQEAQDQIPVQAELTQVMEGATEDLLQVPAVAAAALADILGTEELVAFMLHQLAVLGLAAAVVVVATPKTPTLLLVVAVLES